MERELDEPKIFKVEIDENKYCVTKCPYNPNVLMGDRMCSDFCKYFVSKDIDRQELTCSYNPVIEFSDALRLDTAMILGSCYEKWRVAHRFKKGGLDYYG